ncbi:hypothetical protein FRC11_007692, partial [Ceratobasidium sp. 423]
NLILANVLVNTSGNPIGWKETNLLQEHLNYWIKVVANPRMAPIKTLKEFVDGLLEAFGDPDTKRAAARKIVELMQTTTTVNYTTKFQTITSDLEWNEPALMGQCMRGLHWKVRGVLSEREQQPTMLQELINAAQRIDAVHHENEESWPKKEKTKEKGKTTTSLGLTTK